MSTVSELFPAGGGDNTIDMVASGTLSNGARVILKSDGKVEVVSASSIAESIPAGSEAIFNSGTTYGMGMALAPNDANKFVMVYRDAANASYGTAIVGTVSGTGITFGSEYVFYSGNISGSPRISFDPNIAGKFVIGYSMSNQGQTVVGTISGTSLTFGSVTAFDSTNWVGSVTVSFDSVASNSFIVNWQASNGYVKMIVGTVAGTSISYGSAYSVNAANSGTTKAVADPSNSGKFISVYVYSSSVYYRVATISGSSISFGTASSFTSTTSSYISLAINTTNEIIFTYADTNNSNYGTARLGTIAGNSITFGATLVFNTGYLYYPAVSYMLTDNTKFIVSYNDGSTNYASTIVGTVNAGSMTFSSKILIRSSEGGRFYNGFIKDSPGKFVVSFVDGGNSYGTSVVGQLAATSTNLTATNLLGIATKAVADGATVPIETLGGYVDNQTGLTIGSDYYVASDGSLTITSTDNVSIGKAISATEINMRDYV